MSEIYYHLTKESSNKKTGPIPVLTSSSNTCPDSCPFKKTNSCYAKGGPLRIHWDKVSSGERSLTFNQLLLALEKLYDEVGSVRLRLWQAGDMPGLNERINIGQVRDLIKRLSKFQSFGYTHKMLSEPNKKAVRLCNDNGIAINLSANNIDHADYLYKVGIAPVSVTLPKDAEKRIITPNKKIVLTCPAVLTDGKVTCASCGGSKGALCWRIDRDYIIGFPAHGAGVNKASEVASGKIKS